MISLTLLLGLSIPVALQSSHAAFRSRFHNPTTTNATTAMAQPGVSELSQSFSKVAMRVMRAVSVGVKGRDPTLVRKFPISLRKPPPRSQVRRGGNGGVERS